VPDPLRAAVQSGSTAVQSAAADLAVTRYPALRCQLLHLTQLEHPATPSSCLRNAEQQQQCRVLPYVAHRRRKSAVCLLLLLPLRLLRSAGFVGEMLCWLGGWLGARLLSRAAPVGLSDCWLCC
jgi:hypothetical protein